MLRMTLRGGNCCVGVVLGVVIVVVIVVVIGVVIELNPHCSENALSEHKLCEVTCSSFISKQMYHVFRGPPGAWAPDKWSVVPSLNAAHLSAGKIMSSIL